MLTTYWNHFSAGIFERSLCVPGVQTRLRTILSAALASLSSQMFPGALSLTLCSWLLEVLEEIRMRTKRKEVKAKESIQNKGSLLTKPSNGGKDIFISAKGHMWMLVRESVPIALWLNQ